MTRLAQEKERARLEHERSELLEIALYDQIIGAPTDRCGTPVTVALAAHETDGAGRIEATIYRPSGASPYVLIVTRGAGRGIVGPIRWDDWIPNSQDRAMSTLRERARVALYRALERVA